MAIYKIYCDESGIDDKSKYYAMGSIWIPKDKGQIFVNQYWNRVRKSGFNKLPEHMKWTNVPGKKDSFFMPLYTMLIDQFFEYDHIYFRMLTTPKSKYNITDKWYHNGDPEEGFYKLYYQLIIHRLDRNDFYHIRLAKREVCKKVSPSSLEERQDVLKQCLNRRMGTGCILSIEARIAKNRLLIQLSDILMGAVCFHYNNWHLESNASEGKVYLANYIANKLKFKSLFVQTNKEFRKFNIFYMAKF